MALEQLTAVLPPSRGAAPPRIDWPDVERAFGAVLPDDYKELVGVYGAGSFDDFLWVLQPAHENPNIDLVTQRSVRLDAMRTLVRQWGGTVPHSLDDNRPGILPWAFTDNGDVCYWLCEPWEKPGNWRVTVNESRGSRWEVFDGSATEFLLAVFTRARRSQIFPEDFPSEDPAFQPLGV